MGPGIAIAIGTVVDMGIVSQLDVSHIPGADRLIVAKIGNGTANFTTGPAMSRQDAEKALLIGFEHATRLIEDGADLLGTGDMGIGNTTPSAAIVASSAVPMASSPI